MEQDCLSQAHLSPGAPLVPLQWAVTMSSTVSPAVLCLEMMEAVVPAAHSPSQSLLHESRSWLICIINPKTSSQ